jgi:hypothetical protein
MRDFLRRIYHKIELESIKRIYRKAIPAPIRKILWGLRHFVNPINIIKLTKVSCVQKKYIWLSKIKYTATASLAIEPLC